MPFMPDWSWGLPQSTSVASSTAISNPEFYAFAYNVLPTTNASIPNTKQVTEQQDLSIVKDYAGVSCADWLDASIVATSHIYIRGSYWQLPMSLYRSRSIAAG